MSKTTNIGWCDSTANAVIGCSKVSEGCAHCYAEEDTPARVLRHRGVETWGAKGVRVPVKSFEANMLAMNRRPWICDHCGAEQDNPLYFCRDCGRTQYHRRRVFADSNSDWLDEQWPIERLAHFLDVIRRCPDISVLLLTKRPENWRERIRRVCDAWCGDHSNGGWGWLTDWYSCNRPPKNIWLGVSVENQRTADERIPELLKIPASVRFLSCEPLLEKVNLGLFGTIPKDIEPNYRLTHERIDWVIVGGESGKNRRDCGVEAIKYVASQCVVAGVPCFVKQDCALKPGQQGRLNDGTWRLKEFPEIGKLQIMSLRAPVFS